MDVHELATMNEAWLARHEYPGRGVLVGRTPKGEAVQVTFIMGRSAGSQNRVYVDVGEGEVQTAPADPAKVVGDPNLTIYLTMAEDVEGGIFVASNGAQTTDADSFATELVNGVFALVPLPGLGGAVVD